VLMLPGRVGGGWQALRLFLSNALYCAASLFLMVAQASFLISNHLDRNFGVNEAAVDPAFAQLQKCVSRFREMLFWVQQVGLPG
jgi:hypothetical protein